VEVVEKGEKIWEAELGIGDQDRFMKKISLKTGEEEKGREAKRKD